MTKHRPRLGHAARAISYPIEHHTDMRENVPSDWKIGTGFFRGDRHPWALSESEARRVYVAGVCELRRRVRAAVYEEHPEVKEAGGVDAKIAAYARLYWDAENYSTILASVAHRSQLTATEAVGVVTHTDEEVEFARKRSDELTDLPTKRRFLSRACMSLEVLLQTLRNGVITTPFWAAFLQAIQTYEEAVWALGQIDGYRASRRIQAASGGRGRAASLATRIAIVVEHFDSELEKNPKTSAPKLAEILVGASPINLSYRKLYEIALDRVKQRVRGR